MEATLLDLFGPLPPAANRAQTRLAHLLYAAGLEDDPRPPAGPEEVRALARAALPRRRPHLLLALAEGERWRELFYAIADRPVAGAPWLSGFSPREAAALPAELEDALAAAARLEGLAEEARAYREALYPAALVSVAFTRAFQALAQTSDTPLEREMLLEGGPEDWLEGLAFFEIARGEPGFKNLIRYARVLLEVLPRAACLTPAEAEALARPPEALTGALQQLNHEPLTVPKRFLPRLLTPAQVGK